jgi:ElaB/YqjD/DUF883 family membrane-anchored ribosome-binding protein
LEFIMSHKNDQTTAHQAADAVDNIADGIRSAAHTVGGSVRSAAHTVRQAAGRVTSAAEDAYEEAGQAVHQSFNHTRDRALAWEDSFEDRVRENPKTALLLAAAFGAVVFAWWKRR